MRRRLTLLSLACGLAATIARAARLPNDFAEAHWLLDYRYGFIKRGLAGSVLDFGVWLGLRPDASTIAWIAGGIFATLSVALLAVASRILARLDWSASAHLALAAFVTSPFVVTAAHLMGYLDHLTSLLTLAGVWLALDSHFAAAGAVAAVAMLVHESFAIAGLPVVALAALMRARHTSRTIVALAGTLAPPFLAGCALLISETFLIDRARLRGQLVHRLSRFPFVEKDIHFYLPEWLTTTTAQNLREEAHRFTGRLSDPLFLRLIVPTAGVLWLLTILSGDRRRRMSRALLALSAMAAPLLLHLVAWDTARIWTYPLLAAFGCLWIAAELRERAPAQAEGAVALLACAAILLNVFSRYPLLDGEVDRFTNVQRLLLYAPFLVTCLGAIWAARFSRRVAERGEERRD